MSRTLFTAALLLALCHTAGAATTLKIATIAPDGTSWMQALRKGAEEIDQRTKGEVKFRFFPGGVMGNDKSVLRKARIGQLQGGVIVSGGLAEAYPDVALYNIPFIFHNYQEVDAVRPRLDPVLQKGLEEHGFVSFGFSEGGFAYLMSNQPVRSLDDLKGRKVWVPEDDRISRIAIESVGVAPIPLPLTDVLPSLQTGLIDTIAGSPVGVIALQWQPQVKYLVDEPLVYLYATMAIDRKAFERISPTDQTVVREVMSDVFHRLDQQNRKDDAAAREALKKQGIKFVTPTPDSLKRENEIRAEVERRLLQQRVLTPELMQQLKQLLAQQRPAASP